MAWEDLVPRLRTSRMEVGARDAFPLLDLESIYLVERGHIDLFATVIDDKGRTRTRKPFIARIAAGNVFMATRPIQGRTLGGEDFLLAFLAAPSLNSSLLQGKREQFLSRENFDLTSVTLIDDWVLRTSEFFVRRGSPPPRDTLLLESDPDIPYEARCDVSAHHLEILWVQADRAVDFVGRPEYELAPGEVLPLSEYLWLFLREDTKISAQHTPGAILADTMWPALDRYNGLILRFAERIWTEEQQKEDSEAVQDRTDKTSLREAMVGDLSGVLGVTDRTAAIVRASFRTPLRRAAAIVAESVGAQLADAPAPVVGVDELDALGPLVAPSGIRTRRIGLTPGWERRDGPSFVGLVHDTEPHPVAVVNRGAGAYEMFDAVTRETARVDRRRAESIDSEAVMFYPPLDPAVDSGMAAVMTSLRGRGRDILQVLLAGAGAALIALLTPILTGELLAEIVPRVDIPMWTAALGALLLGAFATSAVSIVGAFSMLRIEARIDETLQASVWSRLLSLPQPFFKRYLAGDLADRANGVSAVRQLLTGATGASLVSGIFSIFSYLLLFYYSWELALWTAAAVAVLAFASWFFSTRQIRHHRAALAAQGTIDGLVFQLIIGLSKIRQAGVELHALRRWSERYVEQKREHLSARRWGAGQLTFNALFVPLTQLAVSALIWYSLIEGESDPSFTIADFLSFNAAFGQFLTGATGLTVTWTTVITILPLFERVQPILETQPESLRGKVLPDLAGQIECANVSFRYPSASSHVLRNVSFQIRPGDFVAFVGSSGSGKSTLFRLLLGFERPTAGSILFDGHDLLSLDLSALRRHLGVVLQNGQHMPTSIIDIISGEVPLAYEEAWDVVRAVGLDEHIESLPMGMHTNISEGGIGLSGGQRQCLLLARALARKSRVLLLDEPTAMLDNRRQDAVRATLRKLNVTRVIIAHRLSTVIDVDRVYVMQDGRIVETGRYQDLIKRGGVLSELARRQQF